jgi:hypothetical protein
VPTRRMAELTVVARPIDGGAIVLAATASIVWRLLDDWCTIDELDLSLGLLFPEIGPEQRVATRAEIIETLCDANLIERE